MAVSDTRPEIEARLIEAYRQMAPWQKLARALDMQAAVLQLAEARVRAEFPRASAREIQLRVAALYLPAETLRAAYGFSPDAPTPG